MATRAELQQAVDDQSAAAKHARAVWKSFDPVDQDNPTPEEQDKTNALAKVYRGAKSARKNAEKALAAHDATDAVSAVPAPAPAPAPKPKPATKSPSDADTRVLDKKWAVYIAGERAATDKAWGDEIAGPRPAGWTG
jgi:hypothetical protein